MIPTAATNIGATSAKLVHGTVGHREALRQRADGGNTLLGKSEDSRDDVAPTTPTSTAGTRHVTRGSTSRTARTDTPTTKRRGVRLAEAFEERAYLGEEAVGVGRESKELRQLTDNDGDG